MPRTSKSPTANGQAAPAAEQLIPLDRIRPSPHSPRKTFPEAAIAELAESIRAHGLLQAVLVRPVKGVEHICSIAPANDAAKLYHVWPAGLPQCPPDAASAIGLPAARALAALLGADHYELVIGERRLRAARLAGLTEIRATVREMDDRTALEVAVIENDQRSDVTPLERAEGYAALVEQHGVPIEELAQRVGKSVSTIRSLLKLRQLPTLAREALENGHLAAGTAELIARVPGTAEREQLTCVVLAGDSYDSDATENMARRAMDQGGAPLSYRDTRAVITRDYVVELGKAPFPRKSLDLVPAAGSCEACPKRAGNLQTADLYGAEDYAGVRADGCTDPSCYRAKVEAHNRQLLEKAQQQGKTVLPEAEAAKLFERYNPSRLQSGAGYVDLGDTCHEVPKPKGYKALVGKQLAGEVVVAVDPAGNVHELVPKAAAAKVLREEHGVKGSATSNGASKADDRFAREQRERRKKAEAGKTAALKACETVATDVQRAMAGVAGWPPEAREVLRRMALAQVEVCWSDACRRVSARRGLAVEGSAHREAIEDLAGRLATGPELLALIAELLAARRSLSWSGEYSAPSQAELAWWLGWGIDHAALVKEALAEKKAGKKAKVQAGAERVKPARAHTSRFGSGARTFDGGPAATPPDGTNPITRATLLRTILPAGSDGLAALLAARGLGTVGDVLDQAGPVAKKGASYTSHVYDFLRAVPGLDGRGANAVGDALVEAGAVTADGPGSGFAGPPLSAEVALPVPPLRVSAGAGPDANPVGKCRVCGCVESNCQLCVERTGEPCTWTNAARTLCSACLPLLETELNEIGWTCPQRRWRGQLAANGIRCVGHVWGRPDAAAEIHRTGALSAFQAAGLVDAVAAWVKDQLTRTDDGAAETFRRVQQARDVLERHFGG